MDIQIKKMHFVQEFLRIRDEKLVDKLDNLLKTERRKSFESEMKPLSHTAFNELIDQAELDLSEGKVVSARELKDDIDTWI